MNFFGTKKMKFSAMALLGVIGFACVFGLRVGPASGLSTIPKAIAGHSQQSSSDSPVITVTASSVGSFMFSLHGMILEDVHLKGTLVHSSKCHWVASGWNSGMGADGKLHWFRDHHMLVCPNHHSPTGWAKVGGGMTGRNCGNPVAFKRPKQVVKVVTLVRSFSKLHIVVKAMASASVTGSCPNSSISGSASASSMVSVTITESTIVEAKGSASAVKAIVSQNLKAQGIATASAQLSLNCSPPPPPPTTTTVTTTTTTTTTTTSPPSVTITNITNLNLTAAGKTSGPAPFSVNASDAGSVTVNADLGGVSDCNSDTPQPSVTFALAAGNNNECVIYYAPNDADQPPSDTITYTAIVTTAGGTAKDVKTDTVDIQYNVRP